MENNASKNYLLVIKRGKNDYLPLEWFRSPLYQGENLNSLSGIDTFTQRFDEEGLIKEALALGLVEMRDKYIEFAIIFYENGKWRELKEGPLFIDSDVLYEDEFIDVLSSRADDKVFINTVATLFGKGFTSEAAKQYEMILRNLESFRSKGDVYLRLALDEFVKMNYDEKRKLRVLVSDKIIKELTTPKQNPSSKVYKINNNDTI